MLFLFGNVGWGGVGAGFYRVVLVFTTLGVGLNLGGRGVNWLEAIAIAAFSSVWDAVMSEIKSAR